VQRLNNIIVATVRLLHLARKRTIQKGK